MSIKSNGMERKQKKDVPGFGSKNKIGPLGFFIATALIFTATCVFAFKNEPRDKYQLVKAENGKIMIPISKVSDGKAQFFAYRDDGKNINFFVLKSSDGVIRAAFDACDICYKERKGYRQEGDYMVCNNCGQKFPSIRINDVKGGCNPAPLNREVSGKYVILKVQDIKKGNFYF
jgi:uncharacterized membrane protein